MRAGLPSGPRVGLLNAMPGDAMSAADRQFTALLAGAELLRYRLPGLGDPGGPPPTYRPFAGLWSDRLDALVVTGTEPPARGLEETAYWEPLAGLLTGVRAAGLPVWLSCLSAHAWTQLHDGIRRRPLPAKLSGVFTQSSPAAHPLTGGLGGCALPHSRHNDVPTDAVAAAGYRVLLAGPECGWSVGVDERGGACAVLVQGHPEYDADTLLREYRRDLGRWRDGRVAAEPPAPVGYLSASAALQLTAHVERLRAGAAEPFPFDAVAAGLRRPWHRPAAALVTAWLATVREPSHA